MKSQHPIPIQQVIVNPRDLDRLRAWAKLGAFTKFTESDVTLHDMINSLEFFWVFLNRLKNLGTVPMGEVEELLTKDVRFRR